MEVLKFPAVQCNSSEVCRHQVLSRSSQNIIHHPEFFLHLGAALIGKWLPKVATKFSSNLLSRESSRYVGTLFCPYLLGIQQIEKLPQKTLNDAKENCLATTANHGTLISINLCISTHWLKRFTDRGEPLQHVIWPSPVDEGPVLAVPAFDNISVTGRNTFWGFPQNSWLWIW